LFAAEVTNAEEAADLIKKLKQKMQARAQRIGRYEKRKKPVHPE
jgi:hypothetical protein